jgi:ketosteroid isomerase-like protein
MAADLEARFLALEAEVRELKDREALRDLRYRYHELINEGKFADIANLFTEDADLDFGALGKAQGRAQLEKFFGAMGGSEPEGGAGRIRVSFIKQFVHNHVVNVRGDSGDGFAYLEAKTVFNGVACRVAGRYNDEYVRQNGKWKFNKMHVTPFFVVPFNESWGQQDPIKIAGR